jgi:glycosyltransferase involved in cell wall biosynthesis
MRDGAVPWKLLYLAPGDIQVARVDRQAIVYFCAALARLGCSVELAALRIRLSQAERHRSADPFSLYQVEPEFPVTLISTRLHQQSPGWRMGIARLIGYVRLAVRRSRDAPRDEALVCYAKNYLPTLALLALRRWRPLGVVFEAHVPPRNALQRFVLRTVDGVVTNSHALARELGVIPRAMLSVHQGIDLDPYDKAEARSVLRGRLNLPDARPLAVYTGKLYYPYEEIGQIVEAAADPASSGTLFVLVGGRDDHVQLWRDDVARRGIDNVVFTGFVPPSVVHEYQVAADVLLLYYPSGMQLNAYRSPGKLFAYMAAGVPIVAVDLPVLREVLGDPPAATLVPPDSPEELARAVQGVLTNRKRPLELARDARARVSHFTWDERARQVVDFVDTLCPHRYGW